MGEAHSQGITLSASISSYCPASPTANIAFARNLTLGSSGTDVKALQQYLNTHGFPVNTIPGNAGSLGYETEYFGIKTQEALAAFQSSVGITPSVGYFGPKTRAYIDVHG